MARELLSAKEIASALGLPEPTAAQVEVIEAPMAPLLVVAGAGSGKTETMTGRVVWLVANGFVEPDQVLGLTFTRKAATELAERIGARLRLLQQRDVWHPRTDDAETGAEVLGGTPTVSTYHSYAGRLVREHALRLGYESESRLLSEAAAWQYASEVVAAYDGPMDDVQFAESTVTAAVVDLAGEMAEHLVEVGDVAAYLERVLAALDALPPHPGARGKDLPGEVKKMREQLRARAGVLPMVQRYLELKRGRDAMDFADQMALAARLAMSFPDIGAIERQRFGAVLLDEFQDTSAAQLELLRSLFVAPGEPSPVTAVGDPHQSIYGWRGASATTLSEFRRAFGTPTHPAPVLPLATSWRNDVGVLEVANAVAGPLRAGSKVPVDELAPRAGAGSGRVAVARVETAGDEAALVASWLEERRAAGAKSAAVLCRKRSQFAALIEALDSRGIPHEVVGLGGLLLTPEIEDITALLHVVNDPSRGDQLMRLLTGPLCRLGAADLDGLMAWARHQQDLRLGVEDRFAPQDDDDAEGAVAEALAQPGVGGGSGRATSTPRDQAPDSSDRVSIVEAVDDPPRPGWTSWDGKRVSDVGLGRLRGLQQAIRRLRSLTALPLADLVGEAERALGLDIEVLAREGYTPAAARAHLDAFADVAATFTVSADRPNLGGFLAWLTAALKEERGLDKGYIEASSDAVQILTIHAAKGLEWDAVAVPGLVEGSFPALSAAVSRSDGEQWSVSLPKQRGWIGGLTDGGIPYALRGDHEGLPLLDWQGASDWKDMETRVEAFLRGGGDHGVEEERRLAYVAFTRARSDMLLTAPVWTDGKTPKVTSRFLTELLEAESALPVDRLAWVDLPDPAVPEEALNPTAAEALSVQWPADPLAQRRAALAAGAAAVRSAVEAQREDAREDAGGLGGTVEQGVLPMPGAALPVLEELDLLLEERRRLAHRGAVTVLMPRHLSASAVVALAQDPARFASALRRPMPEPPALAARRGTAFHAWVEQHFAQAAIVDILDLPGSADDDPGDDGDLPLMKERFLASDWAHRTPAEIEIAVETVIDGIAVRGRIDAVFPRPGGGFTIVDWKTGAKPSGGSGATRALQLAAYRVAFARLRGLDLDDVDAAFYYAATGETVWPDLPDDRSLATLLAGVPE
ncbi:DNA helicase-2/ATP-dependent DNA helicase PcrA [Phycicoccus badiiscoriae]|uniref:DNA 3'-5' helicase n=1 Tax=Pedococcus badiiscoriae TaxID=642776 RepID=A0A852WAT4_9MICO|nr:ATP-dependent DNA helicase [Pedococcus badiiscoriae]NYG06193.1 DNA helicase-2/ATP-dependent DNA helicase PcrA [Pedococcus badiiscoriae]